MAVAEVAEQIQLDPENDLLIAPVAVGCIVASGGGFDVAISVAGKKKVAVVVLVAIVDQNPRTAFVNPFSLMD